MKINYRQNQFNSIAIVFLFIGLIQGGIGRAEHIFNDAAGIHRDQNSLQNTVWEIESFGDADGQRPITKPERSGDFVAMLEFGKATFGGRIGGCNVISFDYSVNGAKIKAKAKSTTAMMCSDEIMRQERELDEAFGQISEFRIEGERLEIIYDEGKLIRLKQVKSENTDKTE